MLRDFSKSEFDNSAEKKAAIESWLNLAEGRCLSPIINSNQIRESIEIALTTNNPLPIILTLCPATKNLETPTSKGQTRELVPISDNPPRLKNFLTEMLGFQLSLRKSLGMDMEIFLILEDSLKGKSENMFVNQNEIDKISQENLKSIKDNMKQIDTEHPGLFQEEKIKIPKVRLQSAIVMQGGKFGIDRDELIQKFQAEIMNPDSSLFPLWIKHLKLAKRDKKFTETAWQGLKSAESIWSRMRFLIAELISDGIFLPEIAKQITFGKTEGLPELIFFASSVRPATLEMETDCFSFRKPRGIIPVFRNIGGWFDEPVDSPWLDEFNTAIINSSGQN